MPNLLFPRNQQELMASMLLFNFNIITVWFVVQGDFLLTHPLSSTINIIDFDVPRSKITILPPLGSFFSLFSY